MGLFQKIVCPKCGAEYSALRPSCPKCGAKKQSTSTRTAPTSDSVRKGTVAAARAEQNSRWQLIFGVCLVAAVIIAVIVLITTTLKGGYLTNSTPTPTATASATITPPPATPTPTATPTVEKLTITFLGSPLEPAQFSMSVGDAIQLGATVLPIDISAPVTWTSSDETIVTVDETGKVIGVGPGTANVVASCFGATLTCTVGVR